MGCREGEGARDGARGWLVVEGTEDPEKGALEAGGKALARTVLLVYV